MLLRKVDLIDLVEVTHTRLGASFNPMSPDDGGEQTEPVTEVHHIASLTSSRQRMVVSAEYGEHGHVGETHTLERIADCGEVAVGQRVLSRTYKYLYEDSMGEARRHEASRLLRAAGSLRFNGAREAETKASALGIRQAWSVDHLDKAERLRNHEVLTQVSVLLLQHPDLKCEVHGRTSTPSACDPDLAVHFGFNPGTQLQQVMDQLAHERATACLEALVARGVPRRQLVASCAGCTGEQKVLFLPRSSFDERLRSDGAAVGEDIAAVFARYDRDRSGDIDAVELRKALNALGLPADTAEAALVLAAYDADASGQLDLGEFAKLVGQLRAFQAGHRLPPPLPDAEAREVFARFDKDGSGDIDYVELREAVGALGLAADIPQAEALLAKYDADSSGRLELAEFETLVGALRAFQARLGRDDDAADGAPRAEWPPVPAFGRLEKIETIFGRYDADRSGDIDMVELRKALADLGLAVDIPQAAQLLADFDADASGRLEYDEFKRLVLQLRTFQERGAAAPAPPRKPPPSRKPPPPKAPPAKPPPAKPPPAKPPATGEGLPPPGKKAPPPGKKAPPPGNKAPPPGNKAPPPGKKAPPPPNKGAAAVVRPSAADAFARYDTDRSGDIDMVELRNALLALGLQVDVPQAAEVLAKYDADKSGRLELDEFERLVAQLTSFQQQQQPPQQQQVAVAAGGAAAPSNPPPKKKPPPPGKKPPPPTAP